MLFNHYVLFYLKWMDILNILTTVVKNMTFVTDNEKVYDKYNEIWEVIRKLLKVKFTVNPVRDDKYLVAKLKIFNKINRTTFNNKNNIPIERNHYIRIPAIDIDSVLKIDNKRAYPQAYLDQCKYKLKKRKIVNYIDDEIIDDDSDSDIDDAVDSHLNFSVPDSYVENINIIMEITIINQDKIILLILKIFTKIVTIVEIIIIKFTKNNK